MGDVCGIFSWHEVCPMEIEVVLLSINEGTKEVEVVVVTHYFIISSG